MLEMNMIDRKATVDLSDYTITKVLTLNDGDSKVQITLTNENFEYLRQTLSPNGLMPDSFEGQINMMNQLIEELEDIRDKENPDWELSKVEYIGGDEDMIYFETREVQ